MILIIMFIGLIAYNYTKDIYTTKEIKYTEFVNLLNEKQIERVAITNDNLIITLKKSNTEYNGKTLYTVNINDGNLIKQLQELKVNYEGQARKQNPIVGMIFALAVALSFIYIILKNRYLKKENEKLLIQIRDLENKTVVKSVSQE